MHHVGVREALHRVELDVPAGVGDRLEDDALHRRVLQPEADDRADLVLVHAPLDRGDERDGDAEVGAPRERLLLVGPQVLATDREVGRLLEPVELEVECGRADPRDLLRERAVAREPDPVRVEHHVPDAALAAPSRRTR